MASAMPLEPELTELEREIGRFGLNRDIAYKTLTNDIERTLIWRTLLFEGDGWSVKSLAAHLRTPMSTVLRKSNSLIERGYIERRGDGLHLTPRGRDLLLTVFRSGLRIANGEQAGWPLRVVSIVSEDGYFHPDSQDIYFPNKHKWVIR